MALHGYVLPFYSFLVESFYHLNFNIVHFCYFQNTFSFVSTFWQTDNIRNKHVNSVFAKQGIVWNYGLSGRQLGLTH